MEPHKAAIYTALYFETGGLFSPNDPDCISGKDWRKCGTSGGKDDRGGMTKYGIAQAGHPNVDIAALNLAGAVAIYKKDFWDRIFGNQFKDPKIAAYLFDSLCGSTACFEYTVKGLQRFLALPADGKLGSQTIATVNYHYDDDLITPMVKARLEFYKLIAEHNPSQGQFVPGWTRRAETFLDKFKSLLALPK